MIGGLVVLAIGVREKKVTTALGIILIAERAALLSGRDDEFVAVSTKGFTGMRWGELVGLDTCYVRPGAIRVEWQLYELDTGELRRCPPKDDSHRTIDTPGWLSDLLADPHRPYSAEALLVPWIHLRLQRTLAHGRAGHPGQAHGR